MSVRARQIVIAGGIAAGCALVVVSLVSAAMAGSPTAPRDAEMEAARRQETPPEGASDAQLERPPGTHVAGQGVVEPARPETRLAAAAPGRVAAIHVEEGDRVAAGDLLIELDADAERARLAAAEAEVEAAAAELAKVRRGLRREDVRAAEAEAAAARARADRADGVLARLERLGASGAVTEDELERARRDAESERHAAEVTAARQAAALAGGRSEDVRAATARLALAEARREEARAALADRVVRAPIAGEVLQVKRRVGEYFTPGGEELLVLGDTRRLRVRMDVDERDVARIDEGASAVVVSDAHPGRRFRGRVVDIGRRMGRKNVRTDEPTERLDTKVLEVVIELGPRAPLIPGMRTTCYVEAAQRGRATARAATR